ncbi:MAG: hypothetical protein H6Q34_665 [Deltaproteobacteria bacterium]|nr:hypothetical protein [Deltaproteobacteria bacterium]
MSYAGACSRRYASKETRLQPERAEHARLLLGERMERLLHADGGTHGADRVVLSDARHAEGDHDAVAEQLHDGAAVRFDGRV